MRSSLSALLDTDSFVLAVACALLILALLLPPLPIKHDTYDYIVIFDITQSMDVQDYELNGSAISRLAFARKATELGLRQLPCGSRIGWGAFTGYRTLLLLAPVEVCANYGDLLSSLSKVDGTMRWENASEITKGVFWSMRAAKELPARPGVIFITDGQEAPPLDPNNPLPLFDDLKPGQIHGWLLGAGGDILMPIPRTDDDGNTMGFWRADDVLQPGEVVPGTIQGGTEHLSALRAGHLQNLAREVGFEYARLREPESIARAMRDKRFARREVARTDLSWAPLLAALALLAGRFSPIELPRLRRPFRRSV